MRTVALDLGTRSIDWCEVVAGKVHRRGCVRCLEDLRPILGPGTAQAVVGFEACRESRHVYDVMRSWNHQARVLDTTRVRRLVGIGEHGRKNDRLDAEKIALAIAREHAPYAHVLGDDARRLRELQEMHRALVAARRREIVHVRGILQGRGERIASCAVEHFARNVREELPTELKHLIEPLLAPLESYEPAIANVDLSIHHLCMQQSDPVVQRLASVPGVSLLVAAAFISTIDDPHRFRNASQVTSYLGLCPREETTGGARPKLGSITKQGNAYARALLVQAAWCVIRSRDTKDKLVQWARAVEQRRGRMRAAVAVARRLARILWSLWRHGCFYDANNERPTDTRVSQQEQARKRGQLKLARNERVHQRTLQATSQEGSSMR